MLRCSACLSSIREDPSITFQPIPAVDKFLNSREQSLALQKYPLSIVFCSNCGLVQVSSSPDKTEFYDDYIYESSSSPDMVDNFHDLCRSFVRNYPSLSAKPALSILDIGCNDCSLLNCFKTSVPQAALFGVDPSPVTGNIGSDSITLIKDYFPCANVFTKKPYDVVTSTNSFAHIPELLKAVQSVYNILADEGLFIIEVSDFNQMVELKAWDYIYHEHLFYYTEQSITFLLNNSGFVVDRIENISTKGGSIRVFAKKSIAPITPIDHSILIDNNKEEFLRLEQSYKRWLDECRNFFATNGSVRLFGYGACATSSVIMAQDSNFNRLELIFDDNSKRHNLYSPSSGISISGIDGFKFKPDDIIIVFAWRFSQQILSRIQAHCHPDPAPKLYSAIDFSRIN